MKKFYSIIALALLLPMGSAAAFDNDTPYDFVTKSDWASARHSIGPWHTVTTRNQSFRSTKKPPHSIGKRTSKIAALRAEAIQVSMKNLTRLRPYASNYPRLVSAVRNYWRNNITKPSTSRLTTVIMRHVQARYRFFVRPQLRSGIAKGVNILKKKLRKS